MCTRAGLSFYPSHRPQINSLDPGGQSVRLQLVVAAAATLKWCKLDPEDYFYSWARIVRSFNFEIESRFYWEEVAVVRISQQGSNPEVIAKN